MTDVNAMRREDCGSERGQDRSRSEEGGSGSMFKGRVLLCQGGTSTDRRLPSITQMKTLVEVPQLENEEGHLGLGGAECRENTL